MGSWFSFTGFKDLLEFLHRAIRFREEEKARLRGEAMSAQGRGAQELFKAVDAATTAQVNRLRFVQEQIDFMRRNGFSEQAIEALLKDEAKTDRVANALDVILRHVDTGTITGISVTALPPPSEDQP